MKAEKSPCTGDLVTADPPTESSPRGGTTAKRGESHVQDGPPLVLAQHVARHQDAAWEFVLGDFVYWSACLDNIELGIDGKAVMWPEPSLWNDPGYKQLVSEYAWLQQAGVPRVQARQQFAVKLILLQQGERALDRAMVEPHTLQDEGRVYIDCDHPDAPARTKSTEAAVVDHNPARILRLECEELRARGVSKVEILRQYASKFILMRYGQPPCLRILDDTHWITDRDDHWMTHSDHGKLRVDWQNPYVQQVLKPSCISNMASLTCVQHRHRKR